MAQDPAVNTRLDRLGMALFAAALMLLFASAQPPSSAAADAAWGPGIVAALPAPTDGPTAVTSISCPSAGNCSAVGSGGLLLTQAGGKWSVGVEAKLPADAATTNPNVSINSVSCASAGNCTAVGHYVDSSLYYAQGLLLTETNGTWATGVEAPLPGNAVRGFVDLSSVSCPSAGNCSAVGSYDDGLGLGILLLRETAGTWTGFEASLPADAGANAYGYLDSVSCASAGNCAAVGTYYPEPGDEPTSEGLMVIETAGTWGAGVAAPLPANARTYDQGAGISSVSCPSPGNCSAVGGYFDSSSRGEGLLLTETGGNWATGVEAPLPANAWTGPSGSSGRPNVSLNSVSCVSPGTCAAVGDYVDGSDNGHGVLLSETGGTWATGIEAAPPATLAAVSCASAGDCGAVGTSCSGTCIPGGVLTDDDTGGGDTGGSGEALLFTETDGSWTTGVEPSLPADAAGGADLASVSCPSAGNCGAAGSYSAGSGTEGLLIGGAPPLVTLDVSTNGPGAVSSSPAGIGCGTACSHAYPAGTSVTLAATPGAGSAFRGWSAACTGETACPVVIDADHTSITATFDLVPKACLVPRVKGKTVTAARRSITAAACAVRSVRRAASHTIARGRVISERPEPGTRLMHGAKVNLVVSAGARAKVKLEARRGPKTARLPSLGAILPRRVPPFIAYDGPDGIWLIKPNGSDAHQIGPPGASDPEWSPDAAKILFNAPIPEDGPGIEGTWTMNADGGDQRLIRQDNFPGVHPGPGFGDFQWSPDGKQIMFERGESIEISNGDGSDARTVAGGENPSFSPDGKYIAFDAIGPTTPQHIYLIEPDGTGRQRITYGSGESSPSWSPDGTRLVYECLPDAVTDQMQAVCETSRKHPTRRILYTESGDALEYPAWSPHGDRLVYACRRDALGEPHAVCEINPHHPTPYVLYDNYKIALTNPTWNTDGSAILVTVEEPTHAAPQLGLLSFSGNSLRLIGSGSEPDW